MTVPETAKRLAISIDAVYKLIWGDKLKATRDEKGNWEIAEKSVEARYESTKAARKRRMAVAV